MSLLAATRPPGALFVNVFVLLCAKVTPFAHQQYPQYARVYTQTQAYLSYLLFLY